MSELRIISIWYRNFKGLRKFDLPLSGQDADIYAANGIGKTTLADGFQWVVADKNTAHEKKFSIKTLQESGDSLHGYEHEVGLALTMDGEEITLQKIHHETYEKKRGSATESFTGHTNIYRINDVKVAENVFKARIAELFGNEQTFRLLTDPMFLNNDKVFPWEKRRALLVGMCGDVSDADVIAADDALAGLAKILGSRSVDDHKGWLTEQKKKINEDLKALPVRIDEVSQGLPDVSETNRDALEREQARLRADLQGKHQARAQLTEGGAAAEKTKKLRELEAELLEHQNKVRAQADETNREAQARADEANQAAKHALHAVIDQIDDLERRIASRKREIESNTKSIERLNTVMDSLRTQWQTVNDEEFKPEELFDCPICGALPEHQLKHDPEQLLAAFNKSKAERLERNDAEGKQANTEAANLALLNEQARKDITTMTSERNNLEAEKPILPPVTVEVEAVVPDLPWPPVEAEIESLKSEIEQLAGGSNADALAKVDGEIEELKGFIAENEAALAKIEQHETGQARIKELADREKELSAQHEEYERQLYLCEQFTRKQASMLTEKINSHFKLIKWKLFETQINQGIKPCCVATYGGRPWPDLSTGESTQVGMDGVNTLSKYFGIVCPVFVDNAESVTSPITAPGQLIRLIASAEDKSLRTETKQREKVNG